MQGRPETRPACTACWRHESSKPDSQSSCVDVTQWPTIVLTAAGHNSPEQVDCRLQQLEILLGRKETFTLIIDVSEVKRGSRDKRLTDWLEAREAELTRYCAGIALVFKGTLVRFMISSFLVLVRRPMPYRVFDSLPEAHRWSRALISQQALST